MRSSVVLLVSIGSLAGCGAGQSQQQPPPATRDTTQPQPAVYAVRDLVQRAGIAGTVDVRGRCMRMSRVIASGPPPRTRSDWQFADAADSSVAVWVSGTRPDDCNYASSSPAPTVIRAAVERDTVRLATTQPVVRVFLVRVP
ncbi:MAG: hypothetical protein ACT4P7_02625 [Gemmatimonadaceae bacterium]